MVFRAPISALNLMKINQRSAARWLGECWGSFCGVSRVLWFRINGLGIRIRFVGYACCLRGYWICLHRTKSQNISSYLCLGKKCRIHPNRPQKNLGWKIHPCFEDLQLLFSPNGAEFTPASILSDPTYFFQDIRYFGTEKPVDVFRFGAPCSNQLYPTNLIRLGTKILVSDTRVESESESSVYALLKIPTVLAGSQITLDTKRPKMRRACGAKMPRNVKKYKNEAHLRRKTVSERGFDTTHITRLSGSRYLLPLCQWQ